MSISTPNDAATTADPPHAVKMRAIVQTEYGSADVLSVAERDRPEIGADEVLSASTPPGSTAAPGTSWPASRT